MKNTERQLLLMALVEHVELSPEVQKKATQEVGALLLQIVRAERETEQDPRATREGEVDDRS